MSDQLTPADATYTIRIFVERSDLPGAKFKVELSDIAASDAESPDYPVSAVIALFRYWLREGHAQCPTETETREPETPREDFSRSQE